MKLRGGALRNFSIGLIAIAFSVLAHAQTSRWAKPDEPTATMMIDMERKWAEAGCDHNGIERTILADDFYGTAPDGTHYTKQQTVADSENRRPPRPTATCSKSRCTSTATISRCFTAAK
jgi:hypothetical protein